MGDNVKKIFLILITIVACVLIGALVLNLLLPNATETLVDAVEDMVFKATGLGFDFNGNGKIGSGGNVQFQGETQLDTNKPDADVEGFN